MKTVLPLAAAFLFATACGGEHFDRALVENLDARPDLDPIADAQDTPGDAGDNNDAGDAAGTPDGGDGGASDAVSCPPAFGGDLLYVFDTSANVFAGPAPALTALPPGGIWFAYAETGGSAGLSASTTAWNATEGHSCPGSAALTANFTVYGAAERVMALVNFNANWATPKAYARFHAWIKIAAPSTGNLDHLDGLQLITNTNSYSAFQGAFVSASLFADGDWHEVVRDLVPGATYVPGVINQAGVQIIAKGAPPAGSTAPVPTTIYIDDLWVEL